MQYEKTFGDWLKHQRRILDFTQQELADRVGCSIVTVRKIESGDRRPSKQIARLLGIELQISPDKIDVFVAFARGECNFHEFNSQHNGQSSVKIAKIPQPLTQLIGREQDVAAARNLCLNTDVRLLTLIGPPGIGKTRLSIELAHQLNYDFKDGTCFIPLAAISDNELVAGTIAQELNIVASEGKTILEQLLSSLGHREILLVLDNFEQILDSAPLVAELLIQCKQLTIITTSRAALNIRGEHVFPVPPLLLPNMTQQIDVRKLLEFPSIALFVERAQAVRPDVQTDDENLNAIATICNRLDGLPLAIELAAARVKLFSPMDILANMESRLALLRDGPRDLPDRQRTLRSAIRWSYDLLDEWQQILLCRLSIFVGGGTLDAAQSVLGGDEINREQVLAGLESLVNMSLVVRHNAENGAVRLIMLETIREYAHEQLEKAGEVNVMCARHCEHFATWIEPKKDELWGNREKQTLNDIAINIDNLRAAWAWAIQSANANLIEKMLVPYIVWFQRRDLYDEGIRELEAAETVLRPIGDSIVLGRVLTFLGNLNYIYSLDLYAKGIALMQESLKIFERLDTPIHMTHAYHELAAIAILQNELDKAEALVQKCMDIYIDHHDQSGIGVCFGHLGWIALKRGQFGKTLQLGSKALKILQDIGYRSAMIPILNDIGEAFREQGDYSNSRMHHTEALEISEELNTMDYTAWSLSLLARIDFETEDIEGAKEKNEESARINRRIRGNRVRKF